jgi:hypothetical protein
MRVAVAFPGVLNRCRAHIATWLSGVDIKRSSFHKSRGSTTAWTFDSCAVCGATEAIAHRRGSRHSPAPIGVPRPVKPRIYGHRTPDESYSAGCLPPDGPEVAKTFEYQRNDARLRRRSHWTGPDCHICQRHDWRSYQGCGLRHHAPTRCGETRGRPPCQR